MKQTGKIVRKRSCCFNIFSGSGVMEPQNHGVQTLSLKLAGRLSAAGQVTPVDLVPEKRMADRFHVYPDLVGSSRLQAAFDVGISMDMSISMKALQHPIAKPRHSFWSVGRDGILSLWSMVFKVE